ncbi:MAG TPA: hypothetical protein VF545_06665 [Thermoleophilaceae bacterium]|jgi:hypothetical protein
MNRIKLIVTAAFALAMLALPGTALARHGDRDNDRMPDRWERKHQLSTHKKNAKKDPDRDGLSNLSEFRHHSDPRDADTDDDGMDDRGEARTGCNPRDRDSDDDGVEDGDEIAGTIVHFDSGTGVLTIRLTDGTTRSGSVTSATRIECEDEDELHASHNGDGDNSGPGSDSSGPGSGGDDGDRDDRGDDDDRDDRGDDDDDDGENCGTEALTDGRVVREAELQTVNGQSTFTEVELDR